MAHPLHLISATLLSSFQSAIEQLWHEIQHPDFWQSYIMTKVAIIYLIFTWVLIKVIRKKDKQGIKILLKYGGAGLLILFVILILPRILP